MRVWLAAAAILVASRVAAHEERGTASIYRDRKVACPGQSYDVHAMAAAHKALPCGSVVEVTNASNGKTATVVINDRGPWNRRIIDLTPAAAIRAGFTEAQGLAEVVLRRVLGFGERWRGEAANGTARPVKTFSVRP